MAVDEPVRRVQSAVQIKGGDHRLAGVGQETGVAAPSCLRLATRHDKMIAKTDPFGHPRQGLAPDQCRMAPRHRPFVFVRKAFVYKAGRHQLEHPVAEEFHPFVGYPTVRPAAYRAGMGERLPQEVRLGETPLQDFLERIAHATHGTLPDTLEHAVETERSGPLPELPYFAVDGKEKEIGASDKVFHRYEPDEPAVQGIISVEA